MAEARKSVQQHTVGSAKKRDKIRRKSVVKQARLSDAFAIVVVAALYPHN